MRLFPCLLAIVVSFGFGPRCLADEAAKADSVQRALRDIAAANTRFGVDLYRTLAAEDRDGSNLFISPYSLYNVLLMVTEGARGDTSREMGTALKFPDTARLVGRGDTSRAWNLLFLHTGMAELQQRLHRENPADATLQTQIAKLRKQHERDQHEGRQDLLSAGTNLDKRMRSEKRLKTVSELNDLLAQVSPYEIRTANAVWVERTYPLSKSYLDVVARFYRMNGAFDADFREDAEAARSRINQWVEQHTKKRIGELLPFGSVDSATRMVVTNAVYFKGDWLEPFAADDTKPREFRLADGGRSKALIMQAWSLESARYGAFHGDGSFFDTPRETVPGETASTYPADDGFAMLDLPYKGEQLSMLVIAPLQPTKFSPFEAGLTADRLERWLGQLRQRKVHVLLPKFKLETAYQLRGAMERLGMAQAFSPEADLSGLTASGLAADRLFISEVIHKAFVAVDERGTEAVAATAALAVPYSAVFEQPKTIPFIPTFHADRPFIFLIRERESGAVLFMGRVMKPITD